MSTFKRSKLNATDFDRAFERGDVSQHLDLKKLKVRRPVQRINIDIPQAILQKVDREATRVGVTRTSLIKLWIAAQADRVAS